RQLQLNEPRIVITGFDRPNLLYESRRMSKAAERDLALMDILKQDKSSGIIYCATRKAVDAVALNLSERFKDRPICAYHAGMEQADRTRNQERFMSEPGAIAVATNA